MEPAESRTTFEALLGRARVTLGALRLSAALRLMAEFYRDQRAEGCRLEEEGDMLLYQWGTYGFGQPETFQVDLTRQFMHMVGGDEPEMSQLSLTMHYEATQELRALGKGDQWCPRPEDLARFESFIRESEAFLAVAGVQPTRVSLEWGPV
jgi:hypothetical protein